MTTPHALPAGAVKERPILFSAPMVRALLAGTKTQTRRIVKFNASGRVRLGGRIWHPADSNVVLGCPYGQPGDRLWVRETWTYHGQGWTGWEPKEKRRDVKIGYDADKSKRTVFFHEDAEPKTPQQNIPKQKDGEDDFDYRMRYDAYFKKFFSRSRPSIHMPRWASRITLEVTDVRVQRLQEIGANDALAEGIGATEFWNPKELNGRPFDEKWWDDFHFWTHYPQLAYERLWESINGAGSWDANPWVWCISFKRAALLATEKP